MASTAFQKAMAKVPGAASAMQVMKDAEKADNSPPVLDDGVYLLRVKATVGVSPNKDIPYADFKWTIADGQYKGKGWNKTYYFSDEDTDEKREGTFKRLAVDLKTLLRTEDLLLRKESFYSDLNNLIDQVDAATPFVRSKIVTNVSKTDDTKKYLNVYFNEVVDVNTPNSGPVVQSDDSAGAGSSSSGGSDDVQEVRKDMKVIWEGEELTVLSSNPRTKECCLKGEDGTKHPGINWGDVEVLG